MEMYYLTRTEQINSLKGVIQAVNCLVTFPDWKNQWATMINVLVVHVWEHVEKAVVLRTANLTSETVWLLRAQSHRMSALTFEDGSWTHFQASLQASLCLNRIVIIYDIHSERKCWRLVWTHLRSDITENLRMCSITLKKVILWRIFLYLSFVGALKLVLGSYWDGKYV